MTISRNLWDLKKESIASNYRSNETVFLKVPKAQNDVLSK